MKKIILAIDNKKILNKIKEINNFNLIIKNVQYREAILEILKKEKNINFILINEKLSGEISIEELIKKIKIINKKINIIFFLEKSDIKKENKLKKLGIKNIYINNKINKNKILNLVEENKFNNSEKIKNNSEKIINKKYNKNSKKNNKNKLNKNNKIINRKINNNKINNKINNKNNNYINNDIDKKYIENKIITFYGEEKSGKSTIINLLIIYLIEKNKKILLINVNKKIEKNNLIKLNKNYLKNKKEKNKILKYKIIENKIIKNNKKNNNEKNPQNKINENLKIINNLEDNFIKNNQKNIEVNFKFLIDKYKNNYDYILFNIGNQKEFKIKNKILKLSDKKVIIINNNLLGIQAIKKEINSEQKSKLDNKKDLHIIQNKYYFNSISNLIIKNIFKDFCNVHKISYSKNYINLNQKNLENQKIKINKSTKKIFEKIIN